MHKGHQPCWLMACVGAHVSATGHQVLSFVTSGEIAIDRATVTRSSPAPGEIAEAKDIGCVAEFVILVFAGKGLRSPFPDGWSRRAPPTFQYQSTSFFAVRIIDYFLPSINFALTGQYGPGERVCRRGASPGRKRPFKTRLVDDSTDGPWQTPPHYLNARFKYRNTC
jgi:hypothetical protein